MEKSKIIHMGCSHSAGNFGPNGVSVPRLIANNFKDIDVYNMSEYCSSIYYQLIQINSFIQQSPDLIIIQWTTSSRWSFVDDVDNIHKNLQLKNSIEITDNYYVNDLQHNCPQYQSCTSFSDSIFHLNPGSLRRIPKKHRRYKTYKSILTESPQVCGFGTLYSKAIKNYAVQLLKSSNIPFIMYEHELSTENELMDFSCETDIAKYKKYTVDNGNHFGLKGNTEVLSKLIPIIKQKLSV